ncbi:MAG: apolipoprotein N-acyltransferase, partial [Pseudomonadota bacterium]
HLAIARMRSKETGRPTIRSTNTGATALIDHRGAVIEVLPYNKPGLLVAAPQGMQGLTPYSRWGNQPILLTCVVLLMIGLWPQIRQRIR